MVCFIGNILNADDIPAVSRNTEAVSTVASYDELVKYSYVAGMAVRRSMYPNDLFVVGQHSQPIIWFVIKATNCVQYYI